MLIDPSCTTLRWGYYDAGVSDLGVNRSGKEKMFEFIYTPRIESVNDCFRIRENGLEESPEMNPSNRGRRALMSL